MATTSRPPSPSNLPPVPASPTYSYASTANPIPSSFNLPLPPPPRPPHAVLNKSDLEASQIAYADLLTTAKSYRLALAALSIAASTFGSALEACARLKEARSESMPPSGVDSMTNSFAAKGVCTADNLLAASGVHQLIANHQQILSETVYRSFEVPLLHELDQWQRRMEEEEDAYQREAKAMSKEIRKMEKEGLRLHKQRKRDVSKFREHLVQLTGKLDALTGLSGGHSLGLLRDCQEMSQGIVECSAGLVRAEVDIFEALARKGWNGGGLDELLEKGRDLFASDDLGAADAHPNHGAKIFSILPQNRSILAGDTGEGLQPKLTHHSRSDSLLVDGMPYQSLAGAVSGPRDTDVMSMFSERDVPRISEEEEAEDKDPDGGLESTSAQTIVPIEVTATEDTTAVEEEDGEAAKPEDRTESEQGGSERRERRWSVTDDGVVSD
ncbi:uncharacterized protein LY89DRAFT_703822 [Mollisia scopiformis]|uniref:Protein IVY1 n=1 Tax=Mollisia scopiformis TaxID=149040 RepID=A0A194XU59_MOLSC|nr:uncharacterized protein LY89DRAFT_703822 [Mollisia scopiformis]KUJ23242.1 hypothetical protein LY89DRAFT_703822 [Mollisia scopiformis]